MLDVGDPIPDVMLIDDRGEATSLQEVAAGRGLIVFFYPKAMTPGCTTEACDFRDRVEALEALGYGLVGVSPDPPEANASFREREGLSYPLLSDQDHLLADQFGAWGTKKNYGKEYVGLIRSTFVVDSSGQITHVFRNVKATGHAQRVLADLAT